MKIEGVLNLESDGGAAGSKRRRKGGRTLSARLSFHVSTLYFFLQCLFGIGLENQYHFILISKTQNMSF